LKLSDLRQKLALGTVQLGLLYGINNRAGLPDQEEAFRILSLAAEHKISILDSAEAYGKSLEVISAYQQTHFDSSFQVISKFTGSENSLIPSVVNTLHKLKSRALYAYMYHRFSDYSSGSYKIELEQLKQMGLIRKVGVSLYTISELRAVVEDIDIDLIQIPFNPFDASAEKIDLLLEAKARKKEVHVRSVFLQGLFYKNPDELTGNLRALFPALKTFRELIQEHQIGVLEACLNFALYQASIDHVIIGIETSEQLQQNINAVMSDFPESLSIDMKSISIPDERLLNPSTWKL
jgi:aryl-alcohol dehydrogenase-like predicted oxidoreductase